MALTTGEAEAVNTLLSYVTNFRNIDLGNVTAAEALAAAKLLAGAAHQQLGCGWRGGDDLGEAWPEHAGEPPAGPGRRWVLVKTSGTADLYELWRVKVSADTTDVLDEVRSALHWGNCVFLREEAFGERDRDVIEVDGEVVVSSS